MSRKLLNSGQPQEPVTCALPGCEEPITEEPASPLARLYCSPAHRLAARKLRIQAGQGLAAEPPSVPRFTGSARVWPIAAEAAPTEAAGAGPAGAGAVQARAATSAAAASAPGEARAGGAGAGGAGAGGAGAGGAGAGGDHSTPRIPAGVRPLLSASRGHRQELAAAALLIIIAGAGTGVYATHRPPRTADRALTTRRAPHKPAAKPAPDQLLAASSAWVARAQQASASISRQLAILKRAEQMIEAIPPAYRSAQAVALLQELQQRAAALSREMATLQAGLDARVLYQRSNSQLTGVRSDLGYLRQAQQQAAGQGDHSPPSDVTNLARELSRVENALVSEVGTWTADLNRAMAQPVPAPSASPTVRLTALARQAAVPVSVPSPLQPVQIPTLIPVPSRKAAPARQLTGPAVPTGPLVPGHGVPGHGIPGPGIPGHGGSELAPDTGHRVLAALPKSASVSGHPGQLVPAAGPHQAVTAAVDHLTGHGAAAAAGPGQQGRPAAAAPAAAHAASPAANAASPVAAHTAPPAAAHAASPGVGSQAANTAPSPSAPSALTGQGVRGAPVAGAASPATPAAGAPALAGRSTPGGQGSPGTGSAVPSGPNSADVPGAGGSAAASAAPAPGSTGTAAGPAAPAPGSTGSA
jgi:hypothetical protein